MPEAPGTLRDQRVATVSKELQDPRRAVQVEDQTNVAQSPVLEHPPQDGGEVLVQVDEVGVEVPEEPAERLRYGSHGNIVSPRNRVGHAYLNPGSLAASGPL